MNRRGFMGLILGVCAAPAIVHAESLMKIVIPTTQEVMAINGIEALTARYIDSAIGTLFHQFLVTSQTAKSLTLLDTETGKEATPQVYSALLVSEPPNLMIGSVLRMRKVPSGTRMQIIGQ